MNILMSSNSPTQQRTPPRVYSYKINDEYTELITDIDGQTKRVQLKMEATQEGGAMTIHKLHINRLDKFEMDQSEVIMSVFNALELTNPRSFVECIPTIN
jgi:hypothetical protein